MFTNAQSFRHYTPKSLKKQVFYTGIPLAKGDYVITKFTHKELTLVIGIIVALVIIFFVWMNNDIQMDSSTINDLPFIKTYSIEDFTRKALVEFFVFASP